MLIIRHFTTAAVRLAKESTAPAKLFLGRPSNNLSSGLVGLANVGKSTFFQAITKSTLGNPANYPFATIEPEKSLIVVQLEILDHYQKIFKSEKSIPSTHTLYDIAGLTRNASSGEGLGNKFLADIRQVDGIFQVVRGFKDDEIVHIEDNKVDPIRDLVIVNDELILKDLEFIELGFTKVEKLLKRPVPGLNKQVLQLEQDTLEQIQNMLYEGKKISTGTWDQDQIDIINTYNFLTAKPTVFLLNVNELDYGQGQNEFLPDVKAWIAENCPQDRLVLFSAAYETKLNELTNEDPDALQQFIKDIGHGRGSAIPEIVNNMRHVLNLISFYTCGPKEARQWTIRNISTAPEAAGVIHTDLQKTFISSIVYKWKDLQVHTEFNEATLKSAGKQFRQGKKYIVENGDVLIVKAAGGKVR